MKSKILNLFVCTLTFIFVYCETTNKDFGLDLGGIVIKKVDRKIDLTTQLVKINSKLVIENSGSGSVKSFWFVFTDDEVANLAVLAVTVETEVILTSSLVPYPRSISQGEKQLVEYTGNHYFFTPYTVNSQSTTVTLFSPNIISYSRLKPTSTPVDTSINYGPYENVVPFSQDPMKIHFENNSPFLTITRLERIIEISHWGNIAVEENIDLLHTGALLKGAFSRYDYQREHNSYSSIKAFKTILPASAKDVYYRDEIGNISTSHMRSQEDSVELDLKPRFPLFGGWKTHYTLGYNIPSYEHLFYSGSSYLLKMRFLDHVYDDMVVNEMVLKIILPEGVRDIDLKTPYEVERHPDSIHYTYLDTFGRRVVSATKKNLIEHHIQEFELHYTFPAYLMLQEPLLVVIAFFLMFLLVILYVRLDLTLSKDETTEAKMRVSSHCEMVHSHHDKRASLYEKLEEEIQKLKTTKDISHSQVRDLIFLNFKSHNVGKKIWLLQQRKIFSSIKEETQTISELGAKIKSDNAEYSEKVNELQKHDKALLECLQQQLTMVEKLVSGKMSKQHYIDADSNNHKKKEVSLERIKSTLYAI
ncbi:Dolichyl-diphosphooligosaccharide--protein glycosyltransferase subunit 1 [Armadillidium nasatum]|uniref:Dolichyl-diphosphooligosaccharide--protein glycosyltransferase subunit 1 n=1 Tax=Armadillidium nasatum TaxID=96803 RepID=A0A5N5SPJ1_9CRUS|nr:Dolichyl-diphosphooligosaccharide--protein glycosyltransferase subunit 1 [Armadillidium nasatum]